MNATSPTIGQGQALLVPRARVGTMLLAWSFYLCWTGMKGFLNVRQRMQSMRHKHRPGLALGKGSDSTGSLHGYAHA